MKTSTTYVPLILVLLFACLLFPVAVPAAPQPLKDAIYDPGQLKPRDSILKVAPGNKAPNFKLPSISGSEISLSDFEGKSNVVLSFIPAAWTPVCSDQWPGYNIAEKLFQEHNTILLGISVDNIPTLHAWTGQMGKLWFDVLSDFWPHGKVAESYGLLRSNGVAERALVYIKKDGIISHIEVSDINVRPPLEEIVKQLQKMSGS
ncbi:peroxiredoxin [Desulfopila sp. IMCC35008]|uniref:peroxiredoxin n=1 Tax=Desulfopila sp. IMCC35008 TaxID=2653858 RepID=UPI0013D0AD8C|nr:peroxiredoxin [Desulfopila sp. IMCC35008]